MNLRAKIKQEILERGPIPFSRYMEMCLYDLEFGYYSRNAEQFGKGGDFYTSSDVHAVFGRLLSRQFDEIWKLLGSPVQIEILELGPGRGLFAQDVLTWSEKKFPQFFGALHYSLLESSPALRHRLQEILHERLSAGKASLLNATQMDTIPRALSTEVPLVIFANEFFDALPVEIVGPQGKLQIGMGEEGLEEVWEETSLPEHKFLDHYSVHPEAGERLEVQLAGQTYMSKIADAMETGILLVTDYGYTRAEQLAGRHRGTLMTYRRHSARTNPYQAPGEQDITAHVNFTALGAAAESKGMHVRPLVTQSQFLLGIGEANQFADAFEECRLPQEKAKVAMQLKHLITPEGMGESFHVLVGCKNVDSAKTATLSGLNFGRNPGVL